MKNAELSAALFASIKGYVDGEVQRLVAAGVKLAIDGLTIPAGERGPQGEKGLDGAAGDRGDAGPVGESGPTGKDGQDGAAGKDGAPGLPGQDGAPGKDGEPGKDGAKGADGQAGETGAPGEKGADGVNGKDGRDGVDGKDGADGLVGKDGAPGVKGDPGEPGKDGADGLAGKDGAPGIDGRNVTPDEVRALALPLIEAEMAKGLLDLERRGMDVVQRMIERIPAGKDGERGAPGVDGADGEDGLDIDDIGLEVKGDRIVEMSFARRDGTVIRREVKLDGWPLYRGTFRSGEPYEKGDAITYGGSVWVALKDTSTAPPGNDWRQAVKGTR